MRGRELPRIVRTIGKAILGAPFLTLFLGMLLGPPVAFVLETIDLVRMREQAPGIIDAVLIERGGKGTSRADITYHFHAVGRRID